MADAENSKVHHFGDGILNNKYLFVFQEFKAVKPRECIDNDFVFTMDKVNVRIELFDIIEPANDAVRSSIVSCNIKVVSMDVYGRVYCG